MKRKINIITLIAATAIMATSCVKSYDSLFEESAADRIQLGLKYYEDALLDGQTWIMEYFPSEDLKYGGWIYVLRFDENHNVRAWFEGESLSRTSRISKPRMQRNTRQNRCSHS